MRHRRAAEALWWNYIFKGGFAFPQVDKQAVYGILGLVGCCNILTEKRHGQPVKAAISPWNKRI